MKQLIAAVVLTTSTLTSAGTAMKLEGSCSGNLPDATPISFEYFSDYDGCKSKSQAAISFTSGIEGLFTGVRTCPQNKDMYLVNGKYRLNLLDSTGNTSGTFHYSDPQTNKRQTIQVQCDVRDYEYPDC